MKIKRYRGAGIALFRQKEGEYQILLGKRSIKQDYGKWSIPGGGMEKSDKDFSHCAFREFKEETGINFLEIAHSYLGVNRYVFPFFSWRTFLYATNDVQTKYHPSEFSELKWINVNELANYQLCFGVKAEVRKGLRLIRNFYVPT